MTMTTLSKADSRLFLYPKVAHKQVIRKVVTTCNWVAMMKIKVTYHIKYGLFSTNFYQSYKPEGGISISCISHNS